MSDENLSWIDRKLLEKLTMDLLKKYWPTISTVAAGALTFLMPSITAYVSAHPKTAAGVLLTCVLAAYHSTAPKDSNIVNPK